MGTYGGYGGYRDNQFRNSVFFTSKSTGNRKNERVNPPFKYTPGLVRIFDTTQTGGDPENPSFGRFTTQRLQRGFMRNLSTSIGKMPTSVGTLEEPQPYKLTFQYNPTTIQQNVEARQDMYLSILQDPYQLAQPVAASTAFSFELLFDRTHELMNGGPTANLTDVPGQSYTSQSSGEAGDIGVLADLSVLYAIIGQGFTRDTMNSNFEIFKQNAKREYERAVTSGDPLFTQPDYDKSKKIYNERNGESLYGNDKAFEDFFKEKLEQSNFGFTAANDVNIGNAAFLVPMPMRIVFSSLYMIDGYVMSTNVIFTKFSTNMVPIQCRVLLNVNAVYIGFARDKTFITQMLEDMGDQDRAARQDAKKAYNDFCREYGPNLSKYIVSFGDSASTFLPDVFTGDARNQPKAYSFAVNDDGTQQILAHHQSTTLGADDNFYPAITTGFANVGGTEVTQKGGGFRIPTGIGAGISLGGGNPFNDDYKVSGGVHTYYEDGGHVAISRSATVKVYGPFASEAEARQKGRNNKYLVGSFTDSKENINSTDTWISGSNVASRNTGAFSVTGNKLNGNKANSELGVEQFFPSQKNYDDLTNGERDDIYNQAKDTYSNQYFAFYAEASVTADAGYPTARGTSEGVSEPLIVSGWEPMNGKTLTIDLPPCKEVPLSTGDSPYRTPDQLEQTP